ncbi:MAG TPA: hypothetical protein VGF27_19605 [Pseudoduganella sp.]
MQRLYAIFPSGGPGAGLALLRGMVSVHLCALAAAHHHAPLTALALLVLAGLLLLGLITPLASAAAMLAELALTALSGEWTLSGALLLADPVLLLLLGPGAYSCDARLYGRRLLTLPD